MLLLLLRLLLPWLWLRQKEHRLAVDLHCLNTENLLLLLGLRLGLRLRLRLHETTLRVNEERLLLLLLRERLQR